MRLAPAEASKNWNRLVVTALEEYAARRRRLQFEETMAAMAADPAIQAETKSINRTFRCTERDGLMLDFHRLPQEPCLKPGWPMS
jgi:hypothetical protein